MLKIIGTEIHLTKGDSAYLNVGISNTVGYPYKIKAGDELVMTVRSNLDNSLIFQKRIPADSALMIEPKDTMNAIAGRYKYDIELNTEAGEVFTIIPKSTFFIEEEVTHE